MRRTHRSPLAALTLVFTVACEAPPTTAPSLEPLGEVERAVRVPGTWVPGPAVDAIADQQNVNYTGSPRIADGGQCGSDNAFACSCEHPACSGALRGTRAFADFIQRRFPQISSAGGFQCCRQNTGNPEYLSVHSIGRAIDLSIPEIDNDADNTAGDEVANWLIMNAQRIGIQLVTWDRGSWKASRPAGQKMVLYGGPIPHTDHIHMELSPTGAAAMTPFFTTGEVNGGGETCAESCEGSSLVTANCSRIDCAASGQACIPGAPPRCGAPACPPSGTASVCLDANRILNCRDGRADGEGNCGNFGAFCSTAGVAPTEARCVFSFCVASPDEVPTERVTCSVRPGALLECHADATLDEVDCAPGEVCSNLSGEGRCVTPEPACPVNPNESLVITQVCLGDRRVTCLNGNLFGNVDCEPGTLCRDVGGEASCVAVECLTSGVAAPGRAVCLDNGEPAVCTEGGTLTPQGPCPEGESCREGACVAGPPPSTPDAQVTPAEDAAPSDFDAVSDSGVNAVDDAEPRVSGSCSAVPAAAPSAPLWWVGALGVLALRSTRRARHSRR